MLSRFLAASALLAAFNVSALTVENLGAPDSVAVHDGIATFRMAVVDESFRRVPGLAFRFETDPSCGSFDGASVVEGSTDEYGVANAGMFFGLAPTLACDTRFTVAGLAEAVDLSVHVFDPERLVLVVTPSAIETEVNQRFEFRVEAYESGFRVNAFPTNGEVSTSPSGATASLLWSQLGLNSGVLKVGMLANGKPGKYEITVPYYNLLVTLPITQRVSTGSR